MSGWLGFTRPLSAGALAAVMLSTPAEAGADCGTKYVVAPGDTLSRIAARCGSSVEALMQANPRITSPARIAVGWQLNVPGAKTADAGGAAEPLSVTGRIVNGRRCAMIETADGQEYGIVSPELAFVGGALVAVRGQLVEDASCSARRTLMVNELKPAEPT